MHSKATPAGASTAPQQQPAPACSMPDRMAPRPRPTSYTCGKCRKVVRIHGSFHAAWCTHAKDCPGTGRRRGYVRLGLRLLQGGAR